MRKSRPRGDGVCVCGAGGRVVRWERQEENDGRHKAKTRLQELEGHGAGACDQVRKVNEDELRSEGRWEARSIPGRGNSPCKDPVAEESDA